ncbi:MAG: M48 family metallopeptidase [Ruminiclostridium sp.]|nr:M48 family metallopeptidase [Ruminiclostridium sp.]
MTRSVTSEKGTVTYELERKSVKNLNLRIRSDGTVYVSVPKSTALAKADEFVKNHIDFILKHQSRINETRRKSPLQRYYLGEVIEVEVKAGSKTSAQLSGNVLTVYLIAPISNEDKERLTDDAVLRWQKEMARALFPKYLEKAYQRFIKAGLTIPYPTITVKAMKTRWGSCTPSKKKITLNCSLTEKAPLCIEYVVCHELAHFLQQNHSVKFYRILDKVMPEHRELRRILNNK